MSTKTKPNLDYFTDARTFQEVERIRRTGTNGLGIPVLRVSGRLELERGIAELGHDLRDVFIKYSTELHREPGSVARSYFKGNLTAYGFVDFCNMHRIIPGNSPKPLAMIVDVTDMEYRWWKPYSGFVASYASGMSLQDFLKTTSRSRARKALRDLVHNARTLYRSGYVHGDLHMNNVIVREDCSVVIIDPHPRKEGYRKSPEHGYSVFSERDFKFIYGARRALETLHRK